MLIFPKRHLLLRKVIDLIMDNLDNKELINNINTKNIFDNRNKIWVLTGPIAFSKAIYKYINNYKHIILPKIGYYAHSYWQLDNFVEYDGTEGKFYEEIKSKKNHYSQFDRNTPVVIDIN